MIYTITLNPAIDYVVKADNIKEGSVNRAYETSVAAGGKGINVSAVLKNLGIYTIATGFIAGFTGNEVERLIKLTGCRTDFIKLSDGMTRINVKLKSLKETDINANGPEIKKADITKLYEKLRALSSDDILVMAGSSTKSLGDTIYKEICCAVSQQHVKIVVDAEKNLLLNTLPFNPFLIKPNNHELCRMFGIPYTCDKDTIIKYSLKLQDLGAENVLISMAGHGAILVTEDRQAYFAQSPEGKVINSVGAGDSMVAGFLAGYTESNDYVEAFRTGIAAGSASAFSENLCPKEDMQRLLPLIKVEKLTL